MDATAEERERLARKESQLKLEKKKVDKAVEQEQITAGAWAIP